MYKIVTDFPVHFRKEMIFKLIDCYPESEIYDEISQEYEALTQEAYERIEPRAVIALGEVPGSIANDRLPAGAKALYVITTVGGAVSDWSTRLFAQGDYMAGMLVDAMADDYLFQASESLHPFLTDMCGEIHMGIAGRFEAPTGISMEAQRVAYEVCEAKEALDMNIKSSYMLEPVKSTCQVYLLSEDEKEMRLAHNCRECGRLDCKMRSIPPVTLTVETASGIISLLCGDRQSILEAMLTADIYVPAICGHRGVCGKCKIRLKEGKLPPSEADKEFFSEAELAAGLRLSCKAYPREDCTISFCMENEGDMEVVTDYAGADKGKPAETSGPFVIGVDIGTTTIAMQMVDRISGRTAVAWSALNKQRAYGADVISRMFASNNGKKDVLQARIRESLREGITSLLQAQPGRVERIVIAGNTTMIHLLMGYSCETLGVFPFMPVNIKTIQSDYRTLTGDDTCSIPAVIYPGISTFVGGDIVAGLYTCGFQEKKGISLLVDLGTNGEMAIGNGTRILSASTAAGPAFEGGGIAWGTGSIPGAVCGVAIEDGKVRTETIGNRRAVGICGTGVLEAVYELMKAGLVDETGLLAEEYFEEGFPLAETAAGESIILTQKDIREIQMAKSAVRAGIETLILRYDTSYEAISEVYLAGGFGYHIDVKKAAGIGLLPGELTDRVRAVGNTALKGALQYGKTDGAEKSVEAILAVSEEITLSNDKDFNELYMEYMYFDETN